MEVLLADGTEISSGMIAREEKEGWHLPVRELAEALELAVPSGLKDLDYAPVSQLEAAFDLRLGVDSYRSLITIQSRGPLPIQARALREQRAKSLGGRGRRHDPGFPVVESTNEIFNGPIIDQQISYTQNRSDGMVRNGAGFGTAIGAEVIGLETTAFLSGTDRQLDRWRLTLARRDPEGNVLGDLGTTEVEAVDVMFPLFPLVHASRIRKGLFVSSFPLNYSSDFGTQDIQGNVLPGWEIELYQNEVLVDRQIADSNGRYAFNGVRLIYGSNQFRLAIYGPQGQRRDEYRTYRIDSSIVRPGRFQYRLGLSTEFDQTGFLAQVDQSIARNLSVSLASTRAILRGDQEATGFHSASIRGFTDSLAMVGTVVASQRGGTAWQLGAQAPIRSAALSARYTVLSSFRSELFNLRPVGTQTEQAELGFFHSFFRHPRVSMNWSLVRALFQDQAPETHLVHRTAMNTGPLFWNHELSLPIHSTSLFEGILSVHYPLQRLRLRGESRYGSTGLKSFLSEFQLRFSDRNLLTVSFETHRILALERLGANLARELRHFTFGISGNYATTSDYSASLNLSFSLVRDRYRREVAGIHLQGKAQADRGAASVLVFEDQNRNGNMDHGERPISGALVQNTAYQDEYKTDSAGGVFLPALVPYAPTDVSVSPMSLGDPFLKPRDRGRRVVPRAGRVTQVELPVVRAGIVDGIVEMNRRGKRGIHVELFQPETRKIIATVQTDLEGVYQFDDVPPGHFEVRVLPFPLLEKGIAAKPSVRDGEMPAEGGVITLPTFELKEEQ